MRGDGGEELGPTEFSGLDFGSHVAQVLLKIAPLTPTSLRCD